MKHLNKILSISLLGLYGGLANAGPIDLPGNSPLVFKFANREQISATDITSTFVNGGVTTSVTENNWGVFAVSTLGLGTPTVPNTTIELDTTKSPLFTNGPSAQVTGIFYGAQAHAELGGAALASSGGFLDLYWRDASTVAGYTAFNLAAATPGMRTDVNKFTGVTDGVLLAHMAFASGISVDPNTFISGNTSPTLGTPFQGQANSFANIVTSAGGLWASALNGDWFNTAFGTRDFRFNNRYNQLPSWDNSTTGFTGANSDDPATVFTKVPEPESLVLLGVGLLGLGAQQLRKTA
jgi:hypothetical protein